MTETGWYQHYLRSWRLAFPEGGQPGSFDGITWVTPTPAWDEFWFRDNGLREPTFVREVSA